MMFQPSKHFFGKLNCNCNTCVRIRIQQWISGFTTLVLISFADLNSCGSASYLEATKLKPASDPYQPDADLKHCCGSAEAHPAAIAV
jgi:hypothetical protein